MTNDEITTRIKLAPDYESIDVSEIDNAVSDATELVKAYPLKDEIIGYATYLYACHLLFMRVLKHKGRFKSVKADNGEYTKFDGANSDDAWDELKRLLKEQGYGRKVVHFY